MGEDAVQAERSSMGHESQELLVPSPTHSSPTHSLTQLGTAAAATLLPAFGSVEDTAGVLPKDGVSPASQVNAITVLTLLDKLVNMLDTVQENQHKMEQRQTEMESAVRGIQNDVTKLSKSHSGTANTVSKLLEKSRKVSVHMKEVKDKMDKQASQVKRLEVNHAHLLRRNNFKVLIFQEENEIPSSVFVKEPTPLPQEGETESLALDANRSHEEEGLQTIQLSSDEEFGPEEEEEESLGMMELAGEHVEKSRAEKIKRSSLRKVDSLKKAFSRQNIEKKMNKISTKIVSPEQREKIKKSLAPTHQKNPSGKSSSFKVSPLTFNIKKIRHGEAETNVHAEAESSSSAMAAIELAPIDSPEQDVSFTEVHSQLAPGQGEAKAAVEAMEKEEIALNYPAEAELSITEEVSVEYALSATLPQDASHIKMSHGAFRGGDTEDEEQEKEGEGAAVVQAKNVAVEQLS
ncbi:caveolae-associated protein 2b [Electrophorus electricus]|uniref:Caveolae associated protein 2b n=1 Tax=Electrophorus electricus TaxID=8005 RepID=A0AAY5E7D6_ELEEL|nr:caveolae-associated protein 2b [Electrophorus electricus]